MKALRRGLFSVKVFPVATALFALYPASLSLPAFGAASDPDYCIPHIVAVNHASSNQEVLDQIQGNSAICMGATSEFDFYLSAIVKMKTDQATLNGDSKNVSDLESLRTLLKSSGLPDTDKAQLDSLISFHEQSATNQILGCRDESAKAKSVSEGIMHRGRNLFSSSTGLSDDEILTIVKVASLPQYGSASAAPIGEPASQLVSDCAAVFNGAQGNKIAKLEKAIQAITTDEAQTLDGGQTGATSAQ